MRILITLLIVASLSGCMAKAVELVKKSVPLPERVHLLKMAEAGDVEAQYMLGKNYCCGLGVFKDNAEALHWYCMAAKQDQADAFYEIGTLFENTRGLQGSAVPTDPVRAYAFYELAENRYQKDARKARLFLEQKLSQDQKNAAAMLVAQWPNIPCSLPSSLAPKPDPTEMLKNAKTKEINRKQSYGSF